MSQLKLFSIALHLACAAFLTSWFAPASPAAIQQPEPTRIWGTVVEQRKYSIQISTVDGYLDIDIPADTPIEQILDQPKINWESRTLSMELLASSMDGDPSQNVEVEVPLPVPLYLDGWFAHKNEFTRLWNETPKSIVRYQLTGQKTPNWKPTEKSLRLSGMVVDSRNGDEVALSTSDGTEWIRLGDREARLSGFSLLNLIPHQSTVEIEVHSIDGRWTAQQVEFRKVVDRSLRVPPGVPTILYLGDETSIATFRYLAQALDKEYCVMHPPENCRNSDTWPRLGCWLGDYRKHERAWDIIVFNCGQNDLQKSAVEYQSNLTKWVDILRSTQARLIWVPSVGNPKSRDGDWDKIQRLNRWAEQTLKAYPTIEVIELTSEMEQSMAEGNSYEALAKIIAKSVLNSKE